MAEDFSGLPAGSDDGKVAKDAAKDPSPSANGRSSISGWLRSPKLKEILHGYWSPMVYAVVLVVVYLRYGIIFNATLAICSLIALPIAARIFKSREFLRNSVFCVSMLLTYEALQGTVGMLVKNSDVASLAWVDVALFGQSFTAAVQNFFASPTVTLIATFFYSLHVYLVVIAMILFWFASKNVYRGYTYSLIITSYLALATFAIFPTAPPWYSNVASDLLNSGIKMLPSTFSTLEQTFLGAADKVASFPSLHAAYATLFAVYAMKLNPKFGFISVPILLGVLFSTLYLGQHYLIDLIAGVIYALFAFFLAECIIKKLHHKN